MKFPIMTPGGNFLFNGYLYDSLVNALQAYLRVRHRDK